MEMPVVSVEGKLRLDHFRLKAHARRRIGRVTRDSASGSADDTQIAPARPAQPPITPDRDATDQTVQLTVHWTGCDPRNHALRSGKLAVDSLIVWGCVFDHPTFFPYSTSMPS
jgi:hypothetical protein